MWFPENLKKWAENRELFFLKKYQERPHLAATQSCDFSREKHALRGHQR